MAEIREPHSVDRREQIRIHQHAEHEHSTQVVEDLNATRRLAVSRVANLIWLFVMVVEALIGLRIVLKLLAANPDNPIANLVYSITDLFLWPFWGLTVTPSVEGMVLEIPAIIAMFVYALLGWVLVKLVWLLFYWPVSRKVRIVDKEHDH
jgi:hypothetical protein